MAILTEFLAGSGLAIFFHWVPHYQEAAYTICGVGLLLSLATCLLREGGEAYPGKALGKVLPGSRNHLLHRPNRRPGMSGQFAIYDDQVAIEVFDKPGKYFGQKPHSPAK